MIYKELECKTTLNKTKLSQKLRQLENQYGLTSDYQKVIEQKLQDLNESIRNEDL